MRWLAVLLAPTFIAGAALAAPPSAAPLFAATLYDYDNKPVALATYRGKPLIVNFWARWCGPCRVEIPELVETQARHQKKSGIEVLGLNIESEPLPVKEFARAYDVNYPVLLTRDAGLDLMRALGNTKAGLPFTVVIRRDGTIASSKLGAMTRAELDAAVAALAK